MLRLARPCDIVARSKKNGELCARLRECRAYRGSSYKIEDGKL